MALSYLSSGFSKPDMSDSAAVLEAFKFIESAAAEFSDEDEDEEEGREKNILDLAAVRRRPITRWRGRAVGAPPSYFIRAATIHQHNRCGR